MVVPVALGRPAIELGAQVLETEGPGRARLAIDHQPFDAGLAKDLELGAAELGEELVVRSSTSLDGDGRWSGAFASVGDVRPAEVPSAVRGCWSSVFRPDALERFARTGIEPEAVGMAVLIQRQLDPVAGGGARVRADGVVEVVGVAGRPGPLMAGVATGVRGTIGSDGQVEGALSRLPAARSRWSALAEACRWAVDSLAVDRFEWAADDEQIWILQVGRDRSSTAERMDATAGAGDGRVLRGSAASAGVATGPAIHCRASDMDTLPSVAGRVLVVDDPLPHFAPLLWEAAGLVALRGNPGAHLCHVARSLHVPAVVGLESAPGPEVLAADDPQVWLVVDGDAGEVVVERRDGAPSTDHSNP